jgi:hypothetical protein
LSPDGVTGGDGIGFAFSPGSVGQIGKEGAALGIGGLNNATLPVKWKLLFESILVPSEMAPF